MTLGAKTRYQAFSQHPEAVRSRQRRAAGEYLPGGKETAEGARSWRMRNPLANELARVREIARRRVV